MALAAMLPHNHHLKLLNLFHNSIGAQGAFAFLDAIRSNRELTVTTILEPSRTLWNLLEPSRTF